MIIQVDSREKQNQEVIEYLQATKQAYFVSKVYAGDYIDFQSPKVVIDLKKDLLELASNLSKHHARFAEEVRKATVDMNCHFVVLIREPLKSLEDVKLWFSHRCKITGGTLYKIMRTMEEKYSISWRFCDRENAGEEIIKILKEHQEEN